MELPDLPAGWELQSLHRKAPADLCVGEDRWFVSATSADEYVHAWGSTARYAILSAIAKIEADETFGQMSGGRRPQVDLLAALAIPKKPAEMDRRD